MNDYKPFPVDVLPGPFARFVRETGDALQCDPAAVALPALSALGAAIGTTRAASPKRGWVELPIIWSANIARSGAVKTPGFEAATQPLFDAQHDAIETYEQERAEYAVAQLKHEKALTVWKHDKKSTANPPEAPTAPVCVRYLVDDITLEALAPILQENRRGVLLAPDELDGWVQSFGMYKSGGRGADRNRWLRLHRKGVLIVDRKGGRSLIYVRPASVCVTGTIQPDIFARSMSGDNMTSGFTARLLLSMPPPRRKKWTERTVSQAALEAYRRLIASLLRLTHFNGERGPEPLLLELSKDARPVFIDFYNRHGILQFEAGDDAEAAALAKLEGYALRLALISALANDPMATEIGLDAMRRGCALADWFAGEAARVYDRLADNFQDAELRQLIDWIRRKGGRLTVRELTRGPREYRGDAAKAEESLAEIVAMGAGIWVDEAPGHAGGRPSRVFVLTASECGDGDNTTADAPKTGVSSPSPACTGIPDKVRAPGPDDDAGFEEKKRCVGIDKAAAHGGGSSGK